MASILFLHQNMPGQFKHLVRVMAASGRNDVVFVTRNPRPTANVRVRQYSPQRLPSDAAHHYLRRLEGDVLHGQQVARELIRLRDEGFRPHVMVGHAAWGEPLFAKDVFPAAKLVTYAEWWYTGRGGDADFPSRPNQTLDQRWDPMCARRIRNSAMLQAHAAADAIISPTRWQRDQHPPMVRDRIGVIHEGIDTSQIRPRPDATFTLPNGRVLDQNTTVLTYVSRNLEPYRGFQTFIRSLLGPRWRSMGTVRAASTPSVDQRPKLGNGSAEDDLSVRPFVANPGLQTHQSRQPIRIGKNGQAHPGPAHGAVRRLQTGDERVGCTGVVRGTEPVTGNPVFVPRVAGGVHRFQSVVEPGHLRYRLPQGPWPGTPPAFWWPAIRATGHDRRRNAWDGDRDRGHRRSIGRAHLDARGVRVGTASTPRPSLPKRGLPGSRHRGGPWTPRPRWSANRTRRWILR